LESEGFPGLRGVSTGKGEKMPALKVAVIGAGIMGKLHARIFQENRASEVVAVADIDRERAGALARELGITGVYNDHRVMLRESRPDAVVVAVPDYAHKEPVLDSLDSGCHVLCEKPLALTVADARQMVEAAEKRGLRLMVSYHLRGTPEYSTAKEKISSGAIGEVIMASSRKNDTIHVSTDYISWAGRTSPVHFLGTHDLDALCWFLDDMVEEVKAWGHKKVLVARGIDTYDAVQVILKFRKGASATIENSWVYPNTYPALVDAFTQVIGTKGTIIIDRVRHNTEIVTEDRYSYADKSVVLGRIRGSLYVSDECFIDYVLRGSEEHVATGRSGLHCVEVACAIHRSLETGRAVKVG